ncbi:hypothetical protein BCR39DRAFT_526441 [Naematelia encephala]|uniref:RRM domain-containing protein n=1 Tax=Naematelia encephala TaxID=71784 RepID=A0A1Y2B9N1_9TREE|nr:hypothetical protein BCR39DRAFT_526441 [Naematelia encephala]
MSDPNDVWQSSNDDRPRDASPPPRRDRSRSPARNGGSGGGDRSDRGRPDNGEPPVNKGNNLHVSGLARSIDEKYLEDLFSKHGKVDKAEIMIDPHTRDSRGFGFVKMVTSDDANAIIEALNGTTVEGKVLTVAHARRGRARTPTPGAYHGVKIDSGPRYGGGGGGYGSYDRPYQPRSYDSRYERGPPRCELARQIK